MTGIKKVTGPVADAQRIGSLDFLRGVAVLGILVMNIESFSYPEPFSPYLFGYESRMDSEVRFWVYFLFQGKFFSIFTLLFGVGFYLFLDRLDRKGIGLRAMDLYARRLFWLFVFGLIHAYFLWTGDVLYHYAVCGLLLFPFRSFRKRYVLLVIVVFMGVLLQHSYDGTVQRAAREEAYEKALETAPEHRTKEQMQSIKTRSERKEQHPSDFTDEVIQRRSGYRENLALNASHIEVPEGKLYYAGILFRTLIMMLSGILLYRLGIFQNYRTVPRYWVWAAVVLLAGLVVNYCRSYDWTFDYFTPKTNVGYALLATFAKEILALGYVLVLNGLYQRFFSRLQFKPVSNTGKMALTNYILQTVIGVLIFYGYGLGQFNTFSRSELLGIVVGIWAFQLTFSVWWLKRYDFGPLEWLWRKLTYSWLK